MGNDGTVHHMNMCKRKNAYPIRDEQGKQKKRYQPICPFSHHHYNGAKVRNYDDKGLNIAVKISYLSKEEWLYDILSLLGLFVFFRRYSHNLAK